MNSSTQNAGTAVNFFFLGFGRQPKTKDAHPLHIEGDNPLDNPGVIAFPPLIWLVNAVISVLVHLFIRLPIMRYNMCLVCGIVFIILAPTLALSALITMKAAGTNVDPGKPALAIVRGGPVRFTRNPMDI